METVTDVVEIWKAAPGYEGLYEVSNLGRVRRASKSARGIQAGYILRLQKNRSGRIFLRFCKESQYRPIEIHVAVAAAFLGPVPDGCEINHKNGDPADNRLENLEYCTHSENMKHAWRTGLFRPKRHKGSKHHRSKLNEARVREILLCQGKERRGEVAKRYQVSGTLISRIWNRQTWTHVSI